MEGEQYIGNINIALYQIKYLEDVNSDELFNDSFKKYLLQHYTYQELDELRTAMDWAISHPGESYREMLPGIKLSNEEIITVFSKYSKVIDQLFSEQQLNQAKSIVFDKKINILAVEDTQIYYGFLSQFLRNDAFVITSVYSESEALKELITTSYDLIISSLHQQQDSNVHFVQTLAERINTGKLPALPVLVLMAANEKQYIPDSLETGIVDIVEWPFELSKLEQKIAAIIQ